MRIVIAGGSGMIGRALSSALTKRDDEVIILSRNPGKVLGMPAKVKLIKWDGRTVQDWGIEIDQSDAVVNLTGENLSGDGFFPSRWTEERKQRLLHSRVDAGKALTKAIEAATQKPSVFIQASGIAYYGTHQEKALTEGDGSGDDFLAALAREWEASSEPVEGMGVRRVVIRNGIVLSLRNSALRLLLLPYQLFVGGRIGTGQQVYSWIHIEDEVNAIMFLIRNDQARGIFNLTSPNPVTSDEFGRTISKVMKRPHYFPLPGFMLKLAFGEVALMVLEGQKVIPRKLLDLGYKFRYPTLVDALKDLLKKEI